jgi:excisionase family DNA binding protein
MLSLVGAECPCDTVGNRRMVRKLIPVLMCPGVVDRSAIPFAQRLTCTIAEACEVTGLGRTKLYELIGVGLLATTTVGRRRLVLVQSLLSLIKAKQSQTDD